MNGEHESQTELLSRIDLIEAMVQEGRRTIAYWGWAPVLWGVAYLIAIGWSLWSGSPELAWPVTMIAAAAISVGVSIRRRRVQPTTTVSRAIVSVWIAVGTGLFVFCFAAGGSGHYEAHAYLAAIETLLGVANFSSALILRWRIQMAVGILWWVAAVATCLAPIGWVLPILVAATFICMISFGLYLMYRERRDRRRRAIHA